MSLFEAIILAIIEGLTEYLPVSSTGHMILAESFMGIVSNSFVKIYTIAIQLGALLAIFVLYFKRFFQSINFYIKLLVGVIPAVVLGLLFNDIIDDLLESPIIVAISLILGGIILLFVDKQFKNNSTEEISYVTALRIGLYQCLAMIPGISRSGASIVGGMTEGLTRVKAAEFSFFLAIPTLLGATFKKIYDFYEEGYTLNENDINLLIVGNFIAFIVALFSIKTFINFLTNKGFRWFGIYRIMLGSIILIIHFTIMKLTVN